MSKTYISVDMYVEDEINDVLDAFEKIDKKKFDRLTREEWKNIIKINLIHQ
jgi:hypothetical protein